MDELQKLGWMTTPVTVVNGQTVVGFVRDGSANIYTHPARINLTA